MEDEENAAETIKNGDEEEATLLGVEDVNLRSYLILILVSTHTEVIGFWDA
jgi:hypothetical protein